jgi:hypothetical protein
MSIFKFNADLFRAAAACISTQESRYYLCGVHIEPHPTEGVFLVATDGHLMAVFHDPTGYAEKPGILTCDTKAKALKTTKADYASRIVLVLSDTLEGHITAGNPDQVVDRLQFQLVDGSFPDWRRIVPTGDLKPKEGPRSFDLKLLKIIADSAKLAGATDIRATFHQKDVTGPAILRFAGLENGMHILMPVRAMEGDARPDWLAPPA